MAFVNLPDFVARNLLTAAQLNQIVAALQGFAAQSSDITWPLTAGGDLDMDNLYTIVSMRNFWNIINAAEYGLSGSALQDAIDAAETAGATCVLIPPDTVIETTGVTGPDNSDIAIVGCGMSSVIKLASAAAGPIFNTGTSGLSNITLSNLQLDGSAGVAGSDGIQVREVDGFQLRDCLLTGFKGEALIITHSGVTSTSSANIVVDNVTFNAGSGNHIKVDSLDGGIFTNILCKAAASDAIFMEPAAADSIIRDIQMDMIRIESPTGKGISILGNAIASDDKWSRISLSNVKVISPTGDGLEIGEVAKILKNVTISDCTVEGTIGADGIVANIDRGKISDCFAQGALNNGLDLVKSIDVMVTGCHFQDAIVNAIDAEDSTDCLVMHNNVKDAGTEGVRKDNTTRLIAENNIGEWNIGRTQLDDATYTLLGPVATETTMATYTLPANTLSKQGDGLRIRVGAGKTLVDGQIDVRVKLDGNVIASVSSPAVGGNTDVMTEGEVMINSVGASGASNATHRMIGFDERNDTIVMTPFGEHTIDFTTDLTILVTFENANAGTSLSTRAITRELFAGVG